MEVLEKERHDEALEAERRFLEARAARYGAGRAVEFEVRENTYTLSMYALSRSEKGL